MGNDLVYEKYNDEAKAMFNRGESFETIKQSLMNQELSEPMIFAIIKSLKTEHNKKKHKRGLAILFVGLIILLLSFVLTCINFHANESITYVMFGISSVGLIVIFFGLFDLFG